MGGNQHAKGIRQRGKGFLYLAVEPVIQVWNLGNLGPPQSPSQCNDRVRRFLKAIWLGRGFHLRHQASDRIQVDTYRRKAAPLAFDQRGAAATEGIKHRRPGWNRQGVQQRPRKFGNKLRRIWVNTLDSAVRHAIGEIPINLGKRTGYGRCQTISRVNDHQVCFPVRTGAERINGKKG